MPERKGNALEIWSQNLEKLEFFIKIAKIFQLREFSTWEKLVYALTCAAKSREQSGSIGHSVPSIQCDFKTQPSIAIPLSKYIISVCYVTTCLFV